MNLASCIGHLDHKEKKDHAKERFRKVCVFFSTKKKKVNLIVQNASETQVTDIPRVIEPRSVALGSRLQGGKKKL